MAFFSFVHYIYNYILVSGDKKLIFFIIFDPNATTIIVEQDIKNHINLLNYRLKHRDTEAFHVIYRKHFAALRAYAQRYVYDVAVAEDIVQDVFLSLWTNLHKYDPQKEVFPYLLTITRNNSLNYLKRLKIKDSHRDKVIEALLFANIEESGLDEEVKKRLEAVLAQLPEKDYRALIAHIIEYKKVSEIAEEMQVAESTVKTHLKRAMKVLRKQLLLILIGM